MNILCATKRKLSAALSRILPKRKAHKIYTPSPMATQMSSVAKFLHKDIKFLQIYDIIEACMGEHKTIANPTLEEILETERWVYDYIERQFG
jgi:1-deoxy-D-xylulose 5-phosphate reductoisomerase